MKTNIQINTKKNFVAAALCALIICLTINTQASNAPSLLKNIPAQTDTAKMAKKKMGKMKMKKKKMDKMDKMEKDTSSKM